MQGSLLTHLDLVREFGDGDGLSTCLLDTVAWAYNADNWDTTHEAFPKRTDYHDCKAVASTLDWFAQLRTGDQKQQFIRYVEKTIESKNPKATKCYGSIFSSAIVYAGPMLLKLLRQVAAGEKIWLVKPTPAPAPAGAQEEEEEEEVPVHASGDNLIVID